MTNKLITDEEEALLNKLVEDLDLTKVDPDKLKIVRLSLMYNKIERISEVYRKLLKIGRALVKLEEKDRGLPHNKKLETEFMLFTDFLDAEVTLKSGS